MPELISAIVTIGYPYSNIFHIFSYDSTQEDFFVSLYVRVSNSGQPVRYTRKYFTKGNCHNLHNCTQSSFTHHHKLLNDRIIQHIQRHFCTSLSAVPENIVQNETVAIWLVPAQDVHFFYTRSHLSARLKCEFIFSTNFQFIFTFKECTTQFSHWIV